MRTHPSLLIVSAILASITGCKSTPPATEPSAPTAAAVPTAAPSAPSPVPTAPVQAAPKPSTMTAMTSLVPAAPAVTLKFNPTSMDAIEAGTKTSSTRKGIRVFPGKFATAVDGSDDTPTLKIEIVSATPKKLSDLTDADAKSDGSDSLEAMKTTLTTNYPGLGADDMVTVITFKLVK